MSQLLVPVYRGEVEVVKYSDERMIKFAVEVLGEPSTTRPEDLLDPTRISYCYPEYIQWEVNERLKAGMVAIGMESGNWVVTKRENIIP
jgi:hypothetical protein